MARPLRIEFPGAVYHVTSRGNGKKAIYCSDEDRRFFLELFGRVVEEYNWICHAYCLMWNHYHILIETPDGNLSAGMRALNGSYAQAHNRHKDTVGHLFQGRFHSFLVQKDAYLLSVARYIVLNPVRAKLVKFPNEWKWSSYSGTMGQDEKSSFLSTDFLLKYFSNDTDTARCAYHKYIISGMNAESPFKESKDGAILGHQMFLDWVWNNVTHGSEMIKEIPKANRIVGRPTLAEMFEVVKDKKHRNDLIRLAHVRCGYSLTDIAKHLFLSRVAVSRIYHNK